jgi:CBS domain containing-hemolysin-like protein
MEAVEDIIEQPENTSAANTADKELLTNLLHARDRKVADIMIPRADIFAAEESTSLKKMAAMMSESGHSRMPVYRRTLDDVIGFVHIKDITACLVNDRPMALKNLLRKLFFVPPGMPVTKLLLQMRQKRRHIALAVDEFGGVDGLVTIEDVVEEIVGEIDDEYDDPEHAIRLMRKDDGTVVVDARTPIDDFEDQVGQILSEQERQDSDTLAGLVFTLASRIPARGEKIPHSSGIMFEILDADTRRIKRLRVHNLPPLVETTDAAPERG